MKKILILLLTVLMAVTFCVGCGPKLIVIDDDYDVNLEIDYDITGKLKIGITPIYTETWLIDALIKEYNQVYPNVKIIVDEVQGNYNNTLVSYWGAEQNTVGIMPDILLSNSADMHPIIENGILLNLQKYINESVKAGILNLDDFNPVAWKLGQKSFNGNQYVIPRSSDGVVTHLNETRFEEVFADVATKDLPFTPIAGKKIPANGWTWQEFLDTCKVIRAWYDLNNRKSEFLLDSCFDWEPVFNSIFLSKGAKLIDDNGKVIVDTPEVKSAMELMDYCIKERYVAPLGTGAQANYAGGQGCMMFNSAYAKRFYKELTDQEFKYNLTTFPLVTGNLETSYIGAGIGGYGIASTSKNRDLAWTFLRFIMTKDGQNALARGGMTTNPIRKDMTDPNTNIWAKELKEKGINMEAYTYGTEHCVVTDFYTRSKNPLIYSDLLSAVVNMVNTGIGNGEEKLLAKIKACQKDMEYRIAIGK